MRTMSPRQGVGGDQQFAHRAFLHCFHGVADKIHHHLLHLHPVRDHAVAIYVEDESDPQPAFQGADERQGAGFLDQLGKVFDPPLSLAACHEFAQPPDDLAGRQSLFGCVLDAGEEHFGIG